MKLIPVIDAMKCTGCGRCVKVCPKQVLEVKDGKAVIIAEQCLLCSHCYSVCPENAVAFDGLLRKPGFASFRYREDMVKPGKADPEFLVNFVRSRRSVRIYKNKGVPGKILNDLVEFASTAPSGSNCQDWEFTILNGRDKVFSLAQEIGNFFMGLNRIVRNPILRYLTFFVAGKKLISYYRNHYESVVFGLAEAVKGRDPLFHGAPALVIIHSGMEGSLPVEDAQYASYHMVLLAHSLGLGTCYIGYASEVLNSSAKIRRNLGIPKTNRVHTVLAVGYPGIEFLRPALRKPYRCANR